MVDDLEPSVYARSQAAESWNKARRQAFLERLSSTLGLTRRPTELLSFEDVSQKLRLNQNSYRGLQQVPLDQIVGSVGRYNDFTRTFLPLIEDDSWRWRRVAELQSISGLPPIELYKVGDAYFVKDGNHRVSVARQYGNQTIEAYVWEYGTPVGGIAASTEIDGLIVKAEYRAFLDRTGLDRLRPEQDIALTEPGMYPALEVEIELYRENLQKIDDTPHSYEDAATAWYDLVYTTAVELIQDSGILQQFPGRTEADLYLWVSRHRAELAERYGGRVSLRDAVQNLVEQRHQPSTVGRVMHSVASSVAGFVQSLSGDGELVGGLPDQPLPRPSNDEPLGRLLAEVKAYQPEMGYSGQRGDDWRGWRYAMREKLGDLLGLEHVPADDVEVRVVETSLIEGVERSRIELVAADGLVVPGYVMRPVDVMQPLPALLIYPGHDTIREVAGLERSRQRGNALALAQAGFVTLTLEERGFGELGQVDHVALDNVAHLIGRTWMGLVIDDGLRAIDYLQQRPDVLPEHIGVAGLGLGGGLATFTAAVDERLRAVVVQDYTGAHSGAMEDFGHGCDFIPDLRRYARTSDIPRLVVPRPILYVYAAGRDASELAHRNFDRMRPLYEVFRCPDRTRFVQHELGDRFDTELARTWFTRWLKEEEDTSVLLWAPYE